MPSPHPTRLVLIGIALTALTFLTGCQREAHIAVAQNDGIINFTVTNNDGSPACIKGIHIYDPEKKEKMWDLIQSSSISDKGVCEHQFRYGFVPANHESPVHAKILTAGKVYQVSISGPGYIASSTAFTVAPRVQASSSTPHNVNRPSG